MKQAIPPMYECRDDRAVFAELAARLGINDYGDKTEEQPLLARVDPDDVWMNPVDAKARGIADGQTVRLCKRSWLDAAAVKVTSHIAAGVVSIKGGWFAPTNDGADAAGCANVLAEDQSAPCVATTYNTNLVDAAAIDD